MQTKTAEKYFFFGLLLATLLFTFFIFRPFWIVLILGISFSIVLYPMYESLRKVMPSWVSSFLTVLIFTIVVCGPLLGIGTLIFRQSQDLYNSVVGSQGVIPFLDSVGNAINSILPEGVNFDIETRTNEIVSYISENIARVFTATLSAFFSFVLMLLIIFYFLRDGARWKRAIVVLSPLSDREDERIISRLAQSVNIVIKGSLFVAVIQGLVMGIGLSIFGVPNGALWGVVASVSSLLPTMGTSLVSIPAILFLFSIGDTANALGLIVWSFLAVGMIDNLLSPLIVGSKIDIPPLLILFAVLGGIALMGPVGILVGPLTISLLYTLISIYRNEFKQGAQNTAL